ncbi:MAG: hypothetical protein ABEK10_00210 [Candidatus Nanosalina sp.]
MNQSKAMLSLTLLVFISFSAAQISGQKELRQPDLQPRQLNLTELKQKYNARSDQIPGFVGSIIGDQTITVNLTGLETGEKLLKKDIIGVKTNGVKTEEIQWGAMKNPTLKVWIDESDVQKLTQSKNPQKALKEMLKTQEIRYETYTLGNKIKMGIMQLFLSF